MSNISETQEELGKMYSHVTFTEYDMLKAFKAGREYEPLSDDGMDYETASLPDNKLPFWSWVNRNYGK